MAKYPHTSRSSLKYMRDRDRSFRSSSRCQATPIDAAASKQNGKNVANAATSEVSISDPLNKSVSNFPESQITMSCKSARLSIQTQTIRSSCAKLMPDDRGSGLIIGLLRGGTSQALRKQ